MTTQKSPLVIAGTGGSGTRVFVPIARHAGFFMGTDLGDDEDVSDFGAWLREWIIPYSFREKEPLSDQQLTVLRQQFERCVESYRTSMPDPEQKWGWKNPRSIFLLPFLHEQYPEMKFIHVIRDGCDMAFSDNQKQLKLFGKAFLTEEQMAMKKQIRSALMWQQVNMITAKYGETNMKKKYLCVRFEDISLKPKSTIRKIFDFLQTPNADVASAAAKVRAPSTIGRWKNQSLNKRYQALKACRSGLEHFGYWQEDAWHDIKEQINAGGIAVV